MHIHIHTCTDMCICTTHTGSHKHRQVHPICVCNKNRTLIHVHIQQNLCTIHIYTVYVWKHHIHAHKQITLSTCICVRLYAPGVSMCESICVHTHVYVRGFLCVCVHVRKEVTHTPDRTSKHICFSGNGPGNIRWPELSNAPWPPVCAPVLALDSECRLFFSLSFFLCVCWSCSMCGFTKEG